MTRKAIIGIVAVCGLATAVGVAWARGSTSATHVNGISWRNSLKDALAEAKRQGKPVLLLSMFGRIDEEMACANARTLRATLFKDPEFKKLVTTEVVPAWEMVRAVPKIEIDLGDGKKIRRTVRGNAVMYLVNPDGKVLDAFPGVYTSDDFFPMVRASIRDLARADDASVVAYHKSLGNMIPRTAATMGKSVMESPTLDLLGAAPTDGVQTPNRSSSPEWDRFLVAASRISDMSLTPMPASVAIARVSGKPLGDRDPKVVAAEVMKRDSSVNMTRVRPVVHLWLASEPSLPEIDKARDAVLETILKIPYKDPYFGLKDVLLPGTPE